MLGLTAASRDGVAEDILKLPLLFSFAVGIHYNNWLLITLFSSLPHTPILSLLLYLRHDSHTNTKKRLKDRHQTTKLLKYISITRFLSLYQQESGLCNRSQ